MPTLVANCPRCGATNSTFDVIGLVPRSFKYRWQHCCEAPATCRNCSRPTILYIEQTLRGMDQEPIVSKQISANLSAAETFNGSLNRFFEVVRPITLRDRVTKEPPDHLPEQLLLIFQEAATCFGVGCYNAAGAMLRLALDLATKSLLPNVNTDEPQPNKHQRGKLAARLGWLFEQNKLPHALQELADCVREDGNDGAHDGTLTKDEADDLLDFTIEILRKVYTEPERLRLAKERREQRRQEAKS